MSVHSFLRTSFVFVQITCFAMVTLAEVPPPPQTPAKMVVSGRTSTAVDIKIVKTGHPQDNGWNQDGQYSGLRLVCQPALCNENR